MTIRKARLRAPGCFAQKVGTHVVRRSGRSERSPAIYRWGSIGRSIDSVRETAGRSEEHTSELQSLTNLVCRLLLEKKKTRRFNQTGAASFVTASVVRNY